MNPLPIKVLALDLEGTLISNAVSIFPRPGLFTFLDFCAQTFERVVLFTAVSEHRARQVVKLLADEGTAPTWFGDIEIVPYEGGYKDLNLVTNALPQEVLLVDDQEYYVHPSQTDQWVPIQQFFRPYPNDDRALEELKAILGQRVAEKYIS